MIIVFVILSPIILAIGYQLFCIGDGILYRKYDFVKDVELYLKEMEQEKPAEVK